MAFITSGIQIVQPITWVWPFINQTQKVFWDVLDVRYSDLHVTIKVWARPSPGLEFLQMALLSLGRYEALIPP